MCKAGESNPTMAKQQGQTPTAMPRRHLQLNIIVHISNNILQAVPVPLHNTGAYIIQHIHNTINW